MTNIFDRRFVDRPLSRRARVGMVIATAVALWVIVIVCIIGAITLVDFLAF